MRSSDEDDDVQVIRLASSNKTAHITTHQDRWSGTIVLWNDVLRVFPGALYLQRGKRVLPFLKGADFEDLRPPRIAAIPGAVLDVIVKDEMKLDTAGQPQEGATTTREETPPQSKSTVTSATTTSTIKRNPAYGDELAALENYNHIDPPSDFAVRRIAAYGGSGTAVDNNSSIHSDRVPAAAVRRNPAYGDELVALENYSHIDKPNTSARGPQLILKSLSNASQVAASTQDSMNKNDLGKVQHHSYFSAIQSLDDNIVRAIVVPEPPIYPYKARALYSYKAKPGDPFEMGFVKGEVLDIADHKKRWWQVRKQDGTTGMAPSNYLQLI